MIKRKDYVESLDLAIKALNICNNIHDRTGAMKVPLIDVANEIGNGTTKKQIQDGFISRNLEDQFEKYVLGVKTTTARAELREIPALDAWIPLASISSA